MAVLNQFVVTGSKQQWSLIQNELQSFGIQDPQEGGMGISFHGSLQDAYRICLWSRLANRVLFPIHRFHATNQDELYHGIQQVDWYEHIPDEATISVGANTDSQSELSHSQFVSLKTKDAIVDQLRELMGHRPDIDTEQADVRIAVHIRNNDVTVSIDLAGESLHRRGYRQMIGKAPLKETVAAAVLERSGWRELANAGAPLVDPMSGSGTFCIEAASIATDLAPGLNRTYYGFLKWSGHDPKAWAELMNEAKERHRVGREKNLQIFGFDESRQTIHAARQNAMRAGLEEFIQFVQVPFHNLKNPLPGQTPGLVVVNPPWGERLGTEQSLRTTYIELGKRLKSEFGNWQATIITSNDTLARSTGLKAHKKNTVYNGSIKCSIFQFNIHAADSKGPVSQEPEVSEFGNRLKKNFKKMKKWASKNTIHAYRIYDRDMPEYAVAIDYYDGNVHIQEYDPPPGIDPRKAQARLDHILRWTPEVLDLSPRKIHLKVRSRQRGSSQYEKQDTTGRFIRIQEGPAKFWVNLQDYLDTGLFLDHRNTRAMIGELAAGKSFLNLFAYTGTATVHAALGGAAKSTTVDMSNTYLDWAERNFDINGLDFNKHRLVREDCMEWLFRNKEKFDIIFLDPPTFSNSKKMAQPFDIQKDHVHLIRQCVDRLSEDGVLIFSNNYRKFKLDHEQLDDLSIEAISDKTVPEDFSRNKRIHQCWLIRPNSNRASQ